MNELISVIIPVYKAERYLNDCLNSVLASTYRNLEIILVDDGSPDNCGRICDEYATKDSRISVIHQVNQGVSAARNTGLTVSRGNFVAFVDSDDTISPAMFETLLWTIKYTNSDIAACEYTRNEDHLVYLYTQEPTSLRIIDGRDDCVRMFSGEPSARAITWSGPMVWNKLYRRQMIDAEFRQECVPAEDMQFNWEISANCSRMVIVPRALYYWRITPESITNSLSVEKYVTIARIWINIAKNNVHSEKLQAHLYFRAANYAHNALCRIAMSGQEAHYQEFDDQASAVIRQYFRELIGHRDANICMKAVYMLYRYCNPIWKLCLRAYKSLKKVGGK